MPLAYWESRWSSSKSTRCEVSSSWLVANTLVESSWLPTSIPFLVKWILGKGFASSQQLLPSFTHVDDSIMRQGPVGTKSEEVQTRTKFSI